MTLPATLSTTFGLLLLAHAGYSAHEHSLLLQTQSLHTTSAASTANPIPTTLPLDITIETLISVLLIIVGIVLSAEQLKPISWKVWAGEVEREGGGNNPYRGLEERWGFLDVRAKRKEFAEWVKERGSVKG